MSDIIPTTRLPQNVVKNIRQGIVDYDDTEIISRTEIPYNVSADDQHKPSPTFLAGNSDGNYFYITDKQLQLFANEIVYLRALEPSIPKPIKINKITNAPAHIDVDYIERENYNALVLTPGTLIALSMITILLFLAFVTSGSNDVAIEAIRSAR